MCVGCQVNPCFWRNIRLHRAKEMDNIFLGNLRIMTAYLSHLDSEEEFAYLS